MVGANVRNRNAAKPYSVACRLGSIVWAESDPDVRDSGVAVSIATVGQLIDLIKSKRQESPPGGLTF
jgi:hypothetical protein